MKGATNSPYLEFLVSAGLGAQDCCQGLSGHFLVKHLPGQARKVPGLRHSEGGAVIAHSDFE